MTRQEQRLLTAMADLSQQLSHLETAHTPLSDPAMVHLSRKLDALILQWYRVVDGSQVLDRDSGEE